MRYTTDLTLFKNTPLIDFSNTLHFKSNQERDNYFLNTDTYEKLSFTLSDFNFIRDRSTINLNNVNYKDLQGVNYASFVSEFEPNTRYYAYVNKVEYINDRVCRVYLLIDGIMTFTQGKTLNRLSNLRIERQHLSTPQYNDLLWELRNNDDVLKTDSKSYFYEDGLYFDKFLILIQSSADLTSNFGTKDNPNVTTAKGLTFDYITSPLEIYVVEQDNFKEFMEKISEFPWIAQNLQRVMLIPDVFIDKENYSEVSTQFGFNKLSKLKNNATSTTKEINEILGSIDLESEDLYKLFNIDPEQDKHLLRNTYFTIEIYSWDGQKMLIDPSQINLETGLRFLVDKIIGFQNKVAFYLHNYKVEDKENTILNGTNQHRKGAYLNDAIIFNSFDDVPVLIDNYGLSLAKSANQRQLAESKLITNRAKNVLNPHSDLKSKFFDVASIISNLSPMNILGKFNDEYEFYRQQQAEFKDLALETPTITSQSSGNAFQVKHENFGLTLKLSKPSDTELQRNKKYYALFGYQYNRDNAILDDVESMSICNYVKFGGSWTIKGVDVAIVEMMKAQFENGVRLWHYNSNNPFPDTPMKINALNNRRLK